MDTMTFKRNHLSQSSISTLARCPRRFKYQYIEQRPGILTSRLVVGLAYHNTVAQALSYKMLGLPPMSDADIADAFSDFWNHEIKDKVIHDDDGVPQIEATAVDWGKDDPDSLMRSGTKLAQKYNRIYVPTLHPIAVEQEHTASIDGIPLPVMGRLDAELPDNHVIDHKFKKHQMGRAELERDLQSMFYALLKGTPLYMEFHQALEYRAFDLFPKDAGLIVAPVTRTTDDVEWVSRLIREYWRQIESEIFPPNPTSYLCSLEWCPYYINCKLEEN